MNPVDELMQYRHDQITEMFQILFPGNYTWSERTDQAFLDECPGGFAPSGYAYVTTMEYNAARILEVSAFLDNDDFRDFVLAVVAWFMSTSAAYTLESPIEEIIEIFLFKQPEAHAVMSRVAETQGMSLREFLAADRT